MFARRVGWLLMGMLALAGCGDDRVEELPPLQRPSAERRAGLPEVGGRWLHAGWEIAAEDTARVNAEVYRLVPPGEIRVLTQRMDSIAGQYGIPGAFVLPFVGEVRRDGVFAAVVGPGRAEAQLASGRLDRDTLWIELTTLAAAATWPPRTRAAFVRRPRGTAFVRLLGGLPIVTGPDSATLDSMRRDSVRLDSLRRRVIPVPGAAPPAVEQPRPAPERPRPRPEAPPPVRTEPIAPPSGPARIDSVRIRPPLEPRRDTPRAPVMVPPAPVLPPAPPVPRDTIRIGT